MLLDPITNMPSTERPATAHQVQPPETPVLLRYWQMLMRRRWSVAGIIGACILLGIVITLLQTPKFSAEVRIEIRRSQDNVVDVESVTPQDLDQDLEFYQTQYALLQARALAARVARRLELGSKPEFFQAFGVEEFSDDGELGRASASREQVVERNRKAIDILLDNVGVSPIRGSALVDVSFTASDPALARDVSNVWAEEFIESNLDRRFASSQAAREFLVQRLAELRQRLEDSERSLVNYASDSGIVTLSSEETSDGRTRNQRTLTVADIEALNSELAAAIADRIRAESRLRQGVDQAIIDNQTLGALREKRAELRVEYSRLNTQFDIRYPPLVALAAQIEEIDQSIAKAEGQIRQAARTTYDQALERESRFRSQIASLRGQLVNEQQDSIQYNIFQREVDTNRQLYDGLLQRYKEIGVAGVGTNNVSIVDRAELPRDPSSPSLPLNLLVALVLGVALSGGFVLALEQVDQTLQSPNEVGKLGLPLLGVIPREADDDVREALGDRKSPIGEAYLATQTNLSFLTDHGVPDSVMITSTRPGEGKSVSAMALAIMHARVGNRTILVDADIRSPSINGFFDLPNDYGLTNYLAGQSELEPLLHATNEPNLRVLTAGPPPPNAAELLSSKRFGLLIRELEEKYDTVLVDGPPVLGLADVPLISRSVSGVIYTIEVNGVKMGGIENSLNRLRMANATIFGAVVTKYDAKETSGYGYGYGYAYGYGYGDNSSES